MPTRLYILDETIDEYEVVERYEQLKLGLERLSAPIHSCMPDDLPGQQLFLRLQHLIEELDKALKVEIDLIYGERISPDAPMISRDQGGK